MPKTDGSGTVGDPKESPLASSAEERRREIFRAWARGVLPETLASIYGMPLTEIRGIIRHGVDGRPPISEFDPEDYVRIHLIYIEAVREEYAMLAADEKGAVRARAIDGRLAALRHQFEVYCTLGLLPHDLDVQIDLKDAADRLARVLDEHNASPEMRRALAAALRPPQPAISETGLLRRA